MSDDGVAKVFAAAVVSREFREKLLKVEGSLTLLKGGYGREDFDLKGEEIARLAAAEAESLSKFAQKFLGTERS